MDLSLTRIFSDWSSKRVVVGLLRTCCDQCKCNPPIWFSKSEHLQRDHGTSNRTTHQQLSVRKLRFFKTGVKTFEIFWKSKFTVGRTSEGDDLAAWHPVEIWPDCTGLSCRWRFGRIYFYFPSNALIRWNWCPLFILVVVVVVVAVAVAVVVAVVIARQIKVRPIEVFRLTAAAATSDIWSTFKRVAL